MSTRLFLYVRTKKKKNIQKAIQNRIQNTHEKKNTKTIQKTIHLDPFYNNGKYLKLVYSTIPIEPVVDVQNKFTKSCFLWIITFITREQTS